MENFECMHHHFSIKMGSKLSSARTRKIVLHVIQSISKLFPFYKNDSIHLVLPSVVWYCLTVKVCVLEEKNSIFGYASGTVPSLKQEKLWCAYCLTNFRGTFSITTNNHPWKTVLFLIQFRSQLGL